MDSSAVAVIPARGGSKRIPRKNIRMLGGAPLISYPIRMAISSGIFSRVVVSTDDEEIARIASDCGADVLGMRPNHLSDDFASTVSVVAHELTHFAQTGHVPEFACCIYPAAFTTSVNDLADSLEILKGSEVDFVAAVTEFHHPVQRAMRIAPDGALTFLDAPAASMRTQDLELLWHDAGQFYWGRTNAWLEEKPILFNAAAYRMPGDRVVDIDTESDWKRAEALFRAKQTDTGLEPSPM